MSKFAEWKPNPTHIEDFHIDSALSYRDLAHLLVRCAITAPATEFTDAEQDVLRRFIENGLDDKRWTPRRQL